MKKYFIYFLILITFIGIFGPASDVKGQTIICGPGAVVDATVNPAVWYTNETFTQRCTPGTGGGACATTWEMISAQTGVSVAALRAANPTQGECPQGQVFVPVTTPIGICSPSGGIPYPSLQRNCQGVWQACNTPNVIRNGVCVQPSGCPTGFTGTPPNCTATTTPPGGGAGGNTDGDYILLEPLPCKAGETNCENGQLIKFNTKGDNKLGLYLNIMINLFIGLCAVAAVIMIVIGGIEYSTSELVSGKAAAKDRIQNALLGLLLALCSYLILYTINPDLLNTNFGVPDASLDINLEDIIIVKPDGTVTSGTGGPINTAVVGTPCDPRALLSAAQSNNIPLTRTEANTFACIARYEATCKTSHNPPNFCWNSTPRADCPKGPSSAAGTFQVLLIGNSEFYENPTCYAAAQVAGPLNCHRAFRRGFSIPGPLLDSCLRAAFNMNCSLAAAVRLLHAPRSSGFGNWTTDAKSARQRECIRRYGI